MPNTIQILPLGAPAPEAIYRAYALQPGAETLLAEGMGNEKGECKLTYEWSGGKVLHVQVRAFSFEGAPLGASEVVYNAKASEQVRFKVEQAPAPKEFEGIGAVLGRMLPEASLMEHEISILLNSLNDYRKSIPRLLLGYLSDNNLRLWVYSEQLARATELPATFFYGIARFSNKRTGIQEILEESDSELEQRFKKAIKEKAIPETDWESIREQLDKLRLQAKLLQEKRMVIQLIGEENDQPLEYFKVNLL